MLGIHTSKYHASHHIFLLVKDIWWQSEKLIHKPVSRGFFPHYNPQSKSVTGVCFQLFTQAQVFIIWGIRLSIRMESLETSRWLVFKFFIVYWHMRLSLNFFFFTEQNNANTFPWPTLLSLKSFIPIGHWALSYTGQHLKLHSLCWPLNIILWPPLHPMSWTCLLCVN